MGRGLDGSRERRDAARAIGSEALTAGAGAQRRPLRLDGDGKAMEVIVANQTARALLITGRNGKKLKFAPFERRALREGDLDQFDLTRVDEYVDVNRQRPVSYTGLLVVLGLTFWLVPLYALAGAFVGGREYWITGAAIDCWCWVLSGWRPGAAASGCGSV